MTKGVRWTNRQIDSEDECGDLLLRSALPVVARSKENINGFIRQYLPMGTDFSKHCQEELGATSYQIKITLVSASNLNTRLKSLPR
jgi:hypothetical protein